MTNGTRFTQTEIPNGNFPKFLVNGKRPVFLENLLAVSAWILNGSSIEYHENKRQPFSLSVVRFGSQAILISG